MDIVVAAVAAAAEKRPVAPYRLLDAFRGVAALWVLVFHTTHWYPGFHDPVVQSPIYQLAVRGALGVPMFFVISGYCIVAAAEGARNRANPLMRFIRARLRRIYPPYIMSTVLAVIFFSGLGVLAAHRIIPHPSSLQTDFFHEKSTFYLSAVTLTQVPLHVFPIVPVYWSLCYEVAFYAIVALVIALFASASDTPFHRCLSCVTIATLVWMICRPSPVFPFDLWYQFGLGALVYRVVSSQYSQSAKLLFSFVVLLTVIYAWHVDSPHQLGYPSTRMEALFTSGFATLILLLYRHDSIIAMSAPAKFLEWIGTFSYSLYLTHWFVIIVPLQILKRLGGHHNEFWLSVAVQILTAIPAAYLFHLFFEKPWMSPLAKLREDNVEFLSIDVANKSPVGGAN